MRLGQASGFFIIVVKQIFLGYSLIIVAGSMREKMPAEAGKMRGGRLFPLDALRGLIIVVMALDHANHFVAQKHSAGEYWGGPFPAYNSALPFLTRLVTHIAAPGFMFLMGAGMVLFAQSRKGAGWGNLAIRRFFWLRGLLLIVLQFTLVNLAWAWSPGGWVVDVYIGVLFALGSAMILCSFFLELETWTLLALTAVFLLLTQLLVPDPATWGLLPATPLQKMLLWPGGSIPLWSNFPILPWLPLATLGLAYGRELRSDAARVWRFSLWTGLAILAVFFVLRAYGGPGNIRPPAGEGWIPFFNLVKYPPSLTFLLLTMGVNLLLLWLFSRAGQRARVILKPLVVYGRVPLFFYITHLFLYAALGHLFTPQGTTIPRMYLFWLSGLLILYPLCLAYGRFKRSRPPQSLWRFF